MAIVWGLQEGWGVVAAGRTEKCHAQARLPQATHRSAALFSNFVEYWPLKARNAISRQFRKAICSLKFLAALPAAD